MGDPERLRFHVVYSYDHDKDRWWRCEARSYERVGPGEPLGARATSGVHYVQVIVVVERAEEEDDNDVVARAGTEADDAFRKWAPPDHVLDDPAERHEPRR